MKKLFYLSLMILLLTSCSTPEPDLSEIGSQDKAEDYLMEEDLGSYTKKVSYKIGEELENDSDDYTIDFVIKGIDSFDQLENREKLGMLGYFYREFLYEDYVFCGKPDCRWGKLIYKTSNNEYTANAETMLTNGTDEYTWEQLREENGKSAEQRAKEEVESDSTSIDVSSDSVYEYMKAQYDRITDYGANYVPEVHDPMVSELAAERFGITQVEADSIYINKEMGR